MLGLVEKTGADAQLNRANAAAARRVERSDLRGPQSFPGSALKSVQPGMMPAEGVTPLPF